MPTLVDEEGEVETEKVNLLDTEEEVVLSRSFFPVGRGINREYVVSVYGTITQQWEEETFDQKREEMLQWRAEAKSYGKSHVEAKILGTARQMDIQVDSMRELKAAFAGDGSELMAAKIWSSCWCPFSVGWDTNLEGDFLKLKQARYEEKKRDHEGKGCIARVMSEVRKEVIKSINKATDSTHQGKIRMKRTKEEVKETGKHKKRKHGQTLGGFYSLATDEKIGPEEVLKREGYRYDGETVSFATSSKVTSNIRKKHRELLAEVDKIPGSPEAKKVAVAEKLGDHIKQEQRKVSATTG